MTSLAVVRLVAAKDLRVEMRSRVLVNQVLPFAAIVMVLFAFALDKDDLLARVAPGLIWLATLFSMLVVIQRSFAVEADDGALDALRTAGVAAQGIYFGKAAALSRSFSQPATGPSGNMRTRIRSAWEAKRADK